jgi:ubiquinone/menaquinone biosynthesis C-methylase UbiE
MKSKIWRYTGDFMVTDDEQQEMYLNTYKSKNEEEAKGAYEVWAPHYEVQMQNLKWQAPQLCVDLLVKHLKQKNKTLSVLRVLDVGAGTGLVGLELSRLGIKQIDALDLSTHMLDQAKSKQVYQNIFVENAHDMQQIQPNQYDALICVGSLNFGHIEPSAFEQFIKVVKQDGLVAFTTREDYFQQLSKSHQENLSKISQWREIEVLVQSNAVSDMQHRHWCYQVL